MGATEASLQVARATRIRGDPTDGALRLFRARPGRRDGFLRAHALPQGRPLRPGRDRQPLRLGGAKRRELPPVVRRMIVELKAEYPGFSLGEMATICYVRIGRRPHWTGSVGRCGRPAPR